MMFLQQVLTNKTDSWFQYLLSHCFYLLDSATLVSMPRQLKCIEGSVYVIHVIVLISKESCMSSVCAHVCVCMSIQLHIL